MSYLITFHGVPFTLTLSRVSFHFFKARSPGSVWVRVASKQRRHGEPSTWGVSGLLGVMDPAVLRGSPFEIWKLLSEFMKEKKAAQARASLE